MLPIHRSATPQNKRPPPREVDRSCNGPRCSSARMKTNGRPPHLPPADLRRVKLQNEGFQQNLAPLQLPGDIIYLRAAGGGGEDRDHLEKLVDNKRPARRQREPVRAQDGLVTLPDGAASARCCLVPFTTLRSAASAGSNLPWRLPKQIFDVADVALRETFARLIRKPTSAPDPKRRGYYGCCAQYARESCATNERNNRTTI